LGEREREFVPRTTTLISNFTAVVKRKSLLSLQWFLAENRCKLTTVVKPFITVFS
jgi:hypothetical protein